MLTITHCPFCLGHLGPAHCGHSRMNSKWANTVNHLCFMGKIGLYSDFILASVLVVGTTSLRDVTAFSFHYFPYLLYSYSKLNPPLLHSLPTGSHIQQWCWLMTSLPNDSWKQHGRRGKKKKKKSASQPEDIHSLKGKTNHKGASSHQLFWRTHSPGSFIS